MLAPAMKCWVCARIAPFLNSRCMRLCARISSALSLQHHTTIMGTTISNCFHLLLLFLCMRALPCAAACRCHRLWLTFSRESFASIDPELVRLAVVHYLYKQSSPLIRIAFQDCFYTQHLSPSFPSYGCNILWDDDDTFYHIAICMQQQYLDT